MKQKTLFGNEVDPKEMLNNGYTGKYNPVLVGGYKFDEVSSALQKCIRRGLERKAAFWAAILYKSGYSKYLKKRLWIIVHEDIGIANPTLLLYANQLKIDVESKKRTSELEKGDPQGYDYLQVANLILMACRSEKTRMADALSEVIFNQIDKERSFPKIPEIAIDPHTDEGKLRYGRWEQGTREERVIKARLWFDLWSVVTNEVFPDNPYKKEQMEQSGYFGKARLQNIHVDEEELESIKNQVLAKIKSIEEDFQS